VKLVVKLWLFGALLSVFGTVSALLVVGGWFVRALHTPRMEQQAEWGGRG
jgi:hypothetical protein